MTRQFWAFLGVGLVFVAGVVAVIWTSTKGAHLDLDGKIIRVRTMPLQPNPDGSPSTLVLVDFRVTNPSGVPLVLRELAVKLDLDGKQPIDGTGVSKSDVDTMFKVHPELAPKYSDVLAPPDTIAPGKTLDRMAEAFFTTSKAAIDGRMGVIVHIEDVDGAGFDIAEKK